MFASYTRRIAKPFLFVLFTIFLISILEACGGDKTTPRPVSPTAKPSPKSATSITGTVVLGNLRAGVVTVEASAVPVSSAVVWLESVPAILSGITTPVLANFLNATTTDNNGNFTFSNLTAGSYELVIDVSDPPHGPGLPTGGNPASDATITGPMRLPGLTGKLVIPLVAQENPDNELTSLFQTTNAASPPGKGDDVTYAAIQLIKQSQATLQALVPQFFSLLAPAGSAPEVVPFGPPHLTTTSPASNCFSATCAAGTKCACFDLFVPANNPIVGQPSSSGNGYVQQLPPGCAAGTVCFQIDYFASQIGTSTFTNFKGSPKCSPSELVTAEFPLGPPPLTNADGAAFSGCD